MNGSLHIWITGAGRGIGAAITRALADGNRCTVSGRDSGVLTSLAADFPSGSIHVAACDVSNHDSVLRAHESAVAAFGAVNVLVNNAGSASFRPFAETPIEEFDQQIAVNLRGVFSCSSAVVPAMIEQRSGMIITINSVASRTTFRACAAYGASKAGALALTQVMREELRGFGIKVCNLLVGATHTDIWAPDMRSEHGHRMMQSSDVAKAVVMLVDSYTNPRMLYEEIIIRPQLGDL